MEELVTYLLKSAAVLAVFVLIYHFLLRRLTFFQANRFFLMFGLIASIIFPLIEITQTVYVSAPAPVETIPATFYTPTAFVLEQKPETIPVQETGFDFTTLFYCLYSAIGLFFIGKIAIELTSLARLIRSGEKVRMEQFYLVSLSRKLTPFSFFHYICHSINEKKTPEFDLIIDHEKVHARQWHSLDVIISNLYRAVFWFNPLAWWIKRQITENLEFIADAEAKAANSYSISYERTLLSVLASQPQPALANNFFTPSIKKRIFMLQKETSARWHAYKYALILPVIVVFLYSFNVVEKVEYLKSDNPEIMTPENRASLNSNKTDLVDILTDGEKEENPSVNTRGEVSVTSNLSGQNINQRKLQDEILIIKITQDTDRDQLDNKVKRLEELGVSIDLKKAKYKNGKLVHLKFTLDDGKGFTSKHDHDTSNGISAVCIMRKKNDDKIEWEVGNCSSIQAYGVANDQIQDAYIVMKDAKLHEKLAEAQVKLAAAQGRLAQINMDSTMKAFSLAAVDLDSLMMNMDFQMEDIDLEDLKLKLDSLKVNMDLGELRFQFADSLNLAEIRKQIDSISIPEFTFKRADGSSDIIAIQSDFVPLRSSERPLVIINDKIYDVDLSQIASDKINSVSVLKNGEAITRYGSKGENGVIVIDYDGNIEILEDLQNNNQTTYPNYIIYDDFVADYKDKKSVDHVDEFKNFSKEELENYAKKLEDRGYELKIRTFRERGGKVKKLKIDFEGSTYTIQADDRIESLTFTYYKDGRKPVMTSRSI